MAGGAGAALSPSSARLAKAKRELQELRKAMLAQTRAAAAETYQSLRAERERHLTVTGSALPALEPEHVAAACQAARALRRSRPSTAGR